MYESEKARAPEEAGSGSARRRPEGAAERPGPEVRGPRRAGRAGARRPHGPAPVRPAVVPVPVRPAQGEWPVCRTAPPRPYRGPRTLTRRPRPVPVVAPVRGLLAAIAVAMATAAVVVGLALLATVAAGPRADVAPAAPAGSGPVVLTVGAQETVWDVARRVAPGAQGAELSLVAERIAVANSLTSARVVPGQVLRVPAVGKKSHG